MWLTLLNWLFEALAQRGISIKAITGEITGNIVFFAICGAGLYLRIAPRGCILRKRLK
jgi:hypothetical protein